MHFNHFDSMILGAIYQGQGSQIVVEGKHRSVLRVLLAKLARRLRLRAGGWPAIAPVAVWRAMPVVALCPSVSATRTPRDQRTAQRVVATRGPVGASW